jgi:hypothetical protein
MSTGDEPAGLDLHAALTALEQAHRESEAGDAEACVRVLRQVPDGLPLGDRQTFLEIVALVARAARQMGFDDLAKAADALRVGPDDPHLLYDYGYHCTDHGAPWLAVPALALAVAHAPDEHAIRMELVAALEAEARYGEAVTVLAHEGTLDRWIGRYLLVFNCLMSGDVEGARQWYSRLGKPEEAQQQALADRLTGMLTRLQAVTGSSRLDDAPPVTDPRAPLSDQDLRGWHFVLNGAVLTSLSPFGFADGMTGRYAFLNESLDGCRRGLHRLGVTLEAAGRRPSAVTLLPDRSSRILGLAAAAVLDLPTRDWSPTDADAPAGTLVVAYSLSGVAPEVLASLRETPGQLLFEHVTGWTEPPAVAADVCTTLAQLATTPWEAHRRAAPGGGSWIEVAPDERPEAEIVADLLAADPSGPAGDGHTPDDSDEVLAAFVARVSARFGTGAAPRDKVWSPGPVTSSRFW